MRKPIKVGTRLTYFVEVRRGAWAETSVTVSQIGTELGKNWAYVTEVGNGQRHEIYLGAVLDEDILD